MDNQLSFSTMQETKIKFLTSLKSYTHFKKFFKNIKEAKIITYSTSPVKILDTFKKFEIEKLEIIVGNTDDFRETLTGKPDLADELEQLKEDNKLIIYTLKNKHVIIHNKIYILTRNDDSVLILHGSPNFSKNAWDGNQHNSVTEFITEKNSECHKEFLQIWNDKKSNYCQCFLEDLTELINNSDDDRSEIIKLWVEGKVQSNNNEILEVNKKLVKEISFTNDSKIHLTLPEFDSKTMESIKEMFPNNKDTIVTDNSITSTLSSIGSNYEKNYKIPLLLIESNDLMLISQNGKQHLNEDLPKDTRSIAEDLKHIEDYLNSINKYASAVSPELVKTHMFESLLYFFWAPFINLYAQSYSQSNMLSAKNIPFLYIYGESNSGKSSYIKFLLRLISDGQVIEPASAAKVNKRGIRGLRSSMTCFPFVIDDIEKRQIEGYKDILNSYWTTWDSKINLPALILTSNDKRPKKWFKNRAKLLHFDLLYKNTNASQFETVQLMNKSNNLFKWFANLHLQKIYTNGIDIKNDDILYLTRLVFKDLYDKANKKIPEYFPTEPAEDIYDPGAEKWRKSIKRNKITFKKDGNDLIANFQGDMTYEVFDFVSVLNKNIRANKEGMSIVIKNPSVFKDWLKEPIDSKDSLLEKVKSIFLN